jgi:hypothetical protein
MDPKRALMRALHQLISAFVKMTSFGFLFFICGSASYFLMRLFVTKITTELSKSEPRPIGTTATAIPEAAISSESGARDLPGVTPDTQARPFLDAAALMAYQTSSDITTPPTLYIVLAAFLYGFIGGPRPFLFGALAGGFSSTCFRPSERPAPSFNELKYLLEAKIRRKRARSEVVFWLYVAVEVVVLTLIFVWFDGPGIWSTIIACYMSPMFLLLFNARIAFADDWGETARKIA